MLNTDEMAEILTSLQKQYASMETPDFSFVHSALHDRPYHPLVQSIGHLFTVTEDTDPNDDVSFGYLLHAESHQWLLRLSMVGPYAVLLRLDKQAQGELISSLTTIVSPIEAQLLTLLAEHGLHVLDAVTLASPVALQLLNTAPEHTCLYQALFTDTDVFPWEKLV